jgi:hypothetical protein
LRLNISNESLDLGLLAMKNFQALLMTLFIFSLPLLLTSCEKNSIAITTEHIYVAYQIKDRSYMKFVRNANYEIGKNTNPKQQINIDIMIGDRVNNIYSTTAERTNIQQLDPLLKEISPADERAFIASVKRIQEILKSSDNLSAYIVFSGSSDPKTLKAIASICQQIAGQNHKELKIYLLGLSPENKILTTAAFEAIAPNMKGSCIANYQQCRQFIDDLLN